MIFKRITGSQWLITKEVKEDDASESSLGYSLGGPMSHTHMPGNREKEQRSRQSYVKETCKIPLFFPEPLSWLRASYFTWATAMAS